MSSMAIDPLQALTLLRSTGSNAAEAVIWRFSRKCPRRANRHALAHRPNYRVFRNVHLHNMPTECIFLCPLGFVVNIQALLTNIERMKTPTYIWVCHKCGKPNQPHTGICASCGFPATASAMEIDPDEKKDLSKNESSISSNVWLFFPEAAIAGLFALATPLWAIKLFVNGHVLAGLGLVANISACGYCFVWAIGHQQKFLAYLAMVCFLLFAWGIHAGG